MAVMNYIKMAFYGCIHKDPSWDSVLFLGI